MISEQLSRAHDRAGFSCGTNALDEYLKQYALQNQKKRLSQVFVAHEENRIIGYYTVNAESVEWDQLPETVRTKLPRYPVPVALIGRLAVSLDHQGEGWGRRLLIDACYRIVQASRQMGVFAVLVEAKDTDIADFYRKFGFIDLTADPICLFLPLATVEKLFA